MKRFPKLQITMISCMHSDLSNRNGRDCGLGVEGDTVCALDFTRLSWVLPVGVAVHRTRVGLHVAERFICSDADCHVGWGAGALDTPIGYAGLATSRTTRALAIHGWQAAGAHQSQKDINLRNTRE